MYMQFEWDEKKRLSNLTKHGLDFRDAWAVFADHHAYTNNSTQSFREKRAVTIGLLKQSVVVVVVHTDRAGVTRIISMRPASRPERSRYYGNG